MATYTPAIDAAIERIAPGASSVDSHEHCAIARLGVPYMGAHRILAVAEWSGGQVSTLQHARLHLMREAQ